MNCIQPIPLLNPQVISILRLYIANYLLSQFDIQSFTRDSIDYLLFYLYQSISRLLLRIKAILMSQGRTIPNFLHVLASYQNCNSPIEPLIIHLIRRARQEQQELKPISKYNMKNLVGQERPFPSQVLDNEHSNILTLPLQFAVSKLVIEQPLPIRRSIGQQTAKPPIYSYAGDYAKVSRKIDNEEMEKRSSNITNQMRMLVQKEKAIKYFNGFAQSAEHRVQKERSPVKMQFQMCKYL